MTNNALRSFLAARSLDSEISVLAREPSGLFAVLLRAVDQLFLARTSGAAERA